MADKYKAKEKPCPWDTTSSLLPDNFLPGKKKKKTDLGYQPQTPMMIAILCTNYQESSPGWRIMITTVPSEVNWADQLRSNKFRWESQSVNAKAYVFSITPHCIPGWSLKILLKLYIVLIYVTSYRTVCFILFKALSGTQRLIIKQWNSFFYLPLYFILKAFISLLLNTN